jgi:putative oxidoreductase
MRLLVPLGRLLFVLVFLLSAPHHFDKTTIDQAAAYLKWMPHDVVQILVPLSGVIALVGGLSVLCGLYTRFGAWLLILFLVPVTIMMHPFWRGPDPAHTQLTNFLKNTSMCGGALLIAYYGPGPFSFDDRRKRNAPAGVTLASAKQAANK